MKRRYYLLLAVLGVAAILVGWIYESRLRPAVDASELAIPDNIDYYLTNLTYRSMAKDGNLDFEFDSPRLEHYRRTNISRIETPKLHIVRSAGNWRIDSRKGEFEHEANLLRLQNQVIMRRQGLDPLEVRGQSIVFELDADRVISESDITLSSDQARIEADHAVFDLSRRIYQLRNARATYYNDQG